MSLNFEFRRPVEPISVVLGVFISYHQNQNEKKNFKAEMDKLRTILDIWQSCSLTLYLRVRITKCLEISQLVYSILILDIPSEYIKATSWLLFTFM